MCDCATPDFLASFSCVPISGRAAIALFTVSATTARKGGFSMVQACPKEVSICGLTKSAIYG